MLTCCSRSAGQAQLNGPLQVSLLHTPSFLHVCPVAKTQTPPLNNISLFFCS
ncbi:hypothetical protein E2C01_083038 [Portunus trituberculatus]|uniref:Uncharacterized protein n=1 Tax=Portunus trituberculatus TaxID=210409 RepID=A0A5B7J6Q4_PORTR|nr:hypothetical protein [Portunus trituberculatus]